MRIRSIKPDFWRSEDIKALPFEVRLLFIGLWSYVDDNGVGIDDPRLIAADLFALEDDPKDIREYVRDGLARLSRGLQIVRYEADGRRLIFITNWDKHQKIDRPGKPRHPRPETIPTRPNGDELGLPETFSRESRDSLDAGAGEQGNRGTGEQGKTTSLREVGAAGAQAIVAEWIDHCAKRPPGNVIGQLSKQIKAMLEEGIDPDDIRRGVAAWMAKNLHPSTLPSVVNEVMNRTSPPPPAPRPSTTDQRVAAAQALKAQFASHGANVLQLPSGDHR
jgi:hypothetical protein